jgi:ATP-dependent helicase HrpB
VLTSASWGATRRTDLPWLTPPPASAWEQATGLLRLLGAIDANGSLTEKGALMAKLPMHPRLANMVMLSAGSFDKACLLSAVLEEGARGGESDLRRICDDLAARPHRPFARRILQLARRFSSIRLPRRGGDEMSEGALLSLAYPDRVARNRGNGRFHLASGRGAFLEMEDALAKTPYLVCCEMDDRPGDAKLFLACPIDEAEIERGFRRQIVEMPVCVWDRRAERVKCVVRRQLGEMVLKEVAVALDSLDGDRLAAVADALMEGVRQKGVDLLPCWTKEARQARDRINFLHRTVEGWPAADDAALASALRGFVSGMSKWKDLERIDLFSVMDVILMEAGLDRRQLDRLAPVRMEVPSGSRFLVHYAGDRPTVEARLQECFGLMETPKVAGGRVPIVMTLLSPAQRPVQVTADLAGFWREGYQLVRKDLRGRYPKHYWPEDPLTATATRRVRPAGTP